ncbi:MAG: Ppx/GppA phosphatase family protein [Planctomycetota bacterium]|nr:Ppx/GppA phosphatase family protein [Planctomycetota bacterium]
MSSTAESSAIVASPTRAKPVAVIDIGTTSIRMAIGEIGGDGHVRTLERLSQAVPLGKDTFTRGSIKQSTRENCVRVLRSYRRKLAEYDIELQNVRVVATSAVREAVNRLAFQDRIYSATGFQVEAIDEAEVTRVTYLGILPMLKAQPELAEGTTIILEVGGGSTDLLLIQEKNVVYAHSFRLGSLRLREMLAKYDAPESKSRDIMENVIARTIEELQPYVPADGPLHIIALGGDMRFATYQLDPDWNGTGLVALPLTDLEALCDSILVQNEDDLVRKYPLAFSEAESMGPALLVNCRMAHSLELTKLYVSGFNLRDALLNEMTVSGSRTAEFREQIIRSAWVQAQRFESDVVHTRHVAELSRQLFFALQEEHGLDERFEVLLYLAAALHEVGLYVNHKAYHKHSMYLIANSDFFGIGQREQLLVALVARYHRRAIPKPGHDGYLTLNRDDRIAVSKMAAILRVADCLDHSRSQRVKQIDCRFKSQQFVIEVAGVDDLSLEELELKQKGNLFEEVFGYPVVFRRISGSSSNGA